MSIAGITTVKAFNANGEAHLKLTVVLHAVQSKSKWGSIKTHQTEQKSDLGEMLNLLT